MALQLAPVAVRFWITVIILAVVLLVFEDALFELALGEGAEQGILLRSLEVVAALSVSYLAVRRAFRIAKHRL